MGLKLYKNKIRTYWYDKRKLAGIERGHKWEIDIDYVYQMSKQNDYKCYYTDLELDFCEDGGNIKNITASIDRIDSKKDM